MIPEANAAMFETCAVAAKLRNVMRVGGERVKEMDHYVDSVSTPVVSIGAARREGTVGGRPGENVSDCTPLILRLMAESTVPLRATSVTGAPFELRVQKDYLPAAGAALEPSLARYCGILYDLITAIFREVPQIPLERLRIAYFMTIRADAAVTARDRESGAIVVNAMAL